VFSNEGDKLILAVAEKCVKPLKQNRSFLLRRMMGGGIITVILFFLSCTDAGKDFLHSIKRATLLFVVDSRNKQSVDYITSFLSNVETMTNLSDIKFVFLNSNGLSKITNAKYPVLDRAIIRTLSLKKNKYYLFGADKKLIMDGALYGDCGDLIHAIKM